MTDIELISQKCDELKALLIAKNRDYGSSFRLSGGLSGAPAETKLLVRIEDKLARFKKLYENEDDIETDEPLRDTILDTAGYFILLAILLEANDGTD